MQAQGMFPSPLSGTKNKISDNARRIAIALIVIVCIQTILSILQVISVFRLDSLNYFNPFSFGFYFYFDEFLAYSITLVITMYIAYIIFAIFFFILANSYNNLGKYEPKISSNAKKAGNVLIAGIVFGVLYGAILFGVYNLSSLFGIIFTILLGLGFYFTNKMLNDLRDLDRFPGKENKVIIFAQIFLCLYYVLLVPIPYVGLPSMRILFIVSLLSFVTGGIYFIIGLFKLGNDIELIVDATPFVKIPQPPAYYPAQPQPYVQYQPQAQPPADNMMFCSHCGQKVKRTAKFCESCGRNLK